MQDYLSLTNGYGVFNLDNMDLLIEYLRKEEPMRLISIGRFFMGSYQKYEIAKAVLYSDINYARAKTNFIMGMFYGHNFHRIDSETKNDIENQNHHYPYISFQRDSFVRVLQQIPNHKGHSFIDVGCGIGDKVLFAHLLGCPANGIELNADTFTLAKHFLYKERAKVNLINENAFDHNFEHYQIVYMFRPISDSKLMEKLYRHIFESIKNHAVIIEVGFSVSSVANIIDGGNRDNPYYGYIRKHNNKPLVRPIALGGSSITV